MFEEQNESPVAQGEQQPAQVAETLPSNPESGIQKRINELTARYHESERAAQKLLAEKEAQITELIGAISRGQPQQSPKPSVLDDVSQEDAQRVEAIMAPKLRALEEMMRRTEVAHRRQQAVQYATQYVGDERVSTLAARILDDWHQRGIHDRTEQEAVVQAAGVIAIQDRQEAIKAKGSRTSPNTAVLSTQGTTSAQVPRKKDPLEGVNIDELMRRDPAKAAALLEQKLDGVKF